MLGGKCFLALKCVFLDFFDINTLGVDGHRQLLCKLDILLVDGYTGWHEYVLVSNLTSLLFIVGLFRTRANLPSRQNTFLI